MVAAVAALWLCIQPMPAAAATKAGAWPQGPWSGLFRESRPKPRKAAVLAVPLPKARPDEAPKAQSDKAHSKAESKLESRKAEPDKPELEKPVTAAADKAAEPAVAAPPPPSACRLALTDAVAIAPSIPDIKGVGGCGGEDLVRLEAVVLSNQRRVNVKPAAVLRCAMASALADWIRTDMAPLAESLGSTLSDLDNFDSFQCRGRNRVVGARLSEHGRANAIDIRAIKLADGRSISPTDRAVPRETRESVLQSMCARFPTVLGPGSDWYHEDHIHIDLMERRNNYKICQWDVWDPLPQMAPLLPAERPEQAPPREVVAAKSEQSRSEQDKSEQEKSEQAKPEKVKADAAKSAAPASAAKSATTAPAAPQSAPPKKKRRQDQRF